MTMREKVLIAAMGIAVVYAGVTLIRPPSPRKAAAPPDGTPAPTDLQVFADAARGGVTASQPQPGERMMLERSLVVWTSSPFSAGVPAAVTSAALRAGAPRAPVFRYTGFLRQGEVRFAILNGREYRVADPVMPGDFVVVSIDADRVVLSAKGGGRKMSVAMEKPETAKGKQ